MPLMTPHHLFRFFLQFFTWFPSRPFSAGASGRVATVGSRQGRKTLICRILRGHALVRVRGEKGDANARGTAARTRRRISTEISARD